MTHDMLADAVSTACVAQECLAVDWIPTDRDFAEAHQRRRLFPTNEYKYCSYAIQLPDLSSTMILAFLLACASLVSLGVAAPPPGLHGCANHLAFNNTVVRLTGATTFSQYIQCTYQQNHPDGSVTTDYCWYDYQTYLLYHYPNNPLPVDSHPACPNNLPLASIYRIRPSASSSKCVTAMGESDGSPVQIQDCRPDIWRPEQVWHFDNERIRPLATDKCLDVTNGNTNGGKLQIWNCGGTNPNQLFQHWVTNVVIVPEDHIQWKSRFQCLDLTDGILTNGNQLQMWPCNYQNPNQLWFLEPVV